MAGWTHWQAYLLDPLLDAVLARRPDDRALLTHGRRFPAAVSGAAVAAQQAERLGFAVDADWSERHWRCAALDRQDNFARLLGRSLTRDDRLEVCGSWPQPPFVALGLHWGTGFPVLAHLQQAGLQPGFVYLPEDPYQLPSLPARIADRLHLRALARFGPAIRVGGAYQAMQQALAAGRVPVVLFDAPPQRESSLLTVPTGPGIERSLRLRSGVLRLLAAEQVPFVFFRCWMPAQGNRRRLEISAPAQSDQPEDIARQAAGFLLDSLRLDGAQWHFWSQAEALMEPPDQPAPNSASSLETAP